MRSCRGRPSKTCSTPVSINSASGGTGVTTHGTHVAKRVRDLRRHLVLRHRVIWVLNHTREVGRPDDARQIGEGLIWNAGYPPLERAEGIAQFFELARAEDQGAVTVIIQLLERLDNFDHTLVCARRSTEQGSRCDSRYRDVFGSHFGRTAWDRRAARRACGTMSASNRSASDRFDTVRASAAAMKEGRRRVHSRPNGNVTS
jgi:hypothetical protein